MERLAHGITNAVDKGWWKPVILNLGGPPISHLFFFSDDLILFAEVYQEQVNVLNNVLEGFYESLGQKINKDKTRVLFSSNVSIHGRGILSRQLRVQVTDDLGKYLGVPLIQSRVNRSTY